MKNLLLVPFIALLISCGTIEEGHHGVRTGFTGKVDLIEMDQGFYTSFLSSVQEYSGKEIAIKMDNMTPKAGDNLSLNDFDLEIYYRINPDAIAENKIKYTARDVYNNGVWYPGYKLVYSYARNSAYTTVAKFDSLDVHLNRTKIGTEILNTTQAALNASDSGVYTITKVIVRDVKTDPSIENSIKLAVAKNKELEAKTIELDIANKQVEINKALDKSLTPAVLRQRELDVQLQALDSDKANVTFIIGGSNIQPLVNLK